jgi:hypothetical protein
MTIACLGWGSLIWDPRDLPIKGEWLKDGPNLPLEFARESRDGRMTLVIVDHDAPAPTFWATLNVASLNEAVDVLAVRENVEWNGSIGCWPPVVRKDPHSEAIGEWADTKGIHGVVWTNLKPGFRGDRGSVPRLHEVIRHLESLPEEKRADAARYVLSAPAQIVTPYRATLEKLLG